MGSYYGLSPVPNRAIFWANTDLLFYIIPIFQVTSGGPGESYDFGWRILYPIYFS